RSRRSRRAGEPQSVGFVVRELLVPSLRLYPPPRLPGGRRQRPHTRILPANYGRPLSQPGRSQQRAVPIVSPHFPEVLPGRRRRPRAITKTRWLRAPIRDRHRRGTLSVRALARGNTGTDLRAPLGLFSRRQGRFALAKPICTARTSGRF